MHQLFDELDSNGNLIQAGVILVPGLKLPEGHRWVEHEISLSEVKASKRVYIEQQRDLSCFSSVNAIGYTWQTDSKSQTLLANALMLAQLGITPVPPTWRTLDNIDVSVTLDDLKAIVLATAIKTQAAYSQSWTLKAAVDAATTIEEVESIIWT